MALGLVLLYSCQKVNHYFSSFKIVSSVCFWHSVGGKNVNQKVTFKVVLYQNSWHFVIVHLLAYCKASAVIIKCRYKNLNHIFSFEVCQIFLQEMLVGIELFSWHFSLFWAFSCIDDFVNNFSRTIDASQEGKNITSYVRYNIPIFKAFSQGLSLLSFGNFKIWATFILNLFGICM